MGSYENGAFTRRAIVDACKKLFYEKGYHETSYADICEEAHVNRGTIYYHFPNKELMRLEVQWEFFIHAKHIAEQHCIDPLYNGIVAMGILWVQLKQNANFRRFIRQACLDYPIYTGKRDISYFYYTAHEYLWKGIVDKNQIASIPFTTVYGYIMSCLLLLCEYPAQYDGWDLYTHCSRSCLHIWGASEVPVEEILTKSKEYLDAIPPEALTFPYGYLRSPTP